MQMVRVSYLLLFTKGPQGSGGTARATGSQEHWGGEQWALRVHGGPRGDMWLEHATRDCLGLLWASWGHEKLWVVTEGRWGLLGADGDHRGPRGATEAQLFKIEMLYIVFAHSFVFAYCFVFALSLVTGVTRGQCHIGWLHESMRVRCTSHGSIEN